jgi:hypothetical protein
VAITDKLAKSDDEDTEVESEAENDAEEEAEENSTCSNDIVDTHDGPSNIEERESSSRVTHGNK